MALKRSPFIDAGIGGILFKLELGPFILLERAIPRFNNERISFFFFFSKIEESWHSAYMSWISVPVQYMLHKKGKREEKKNGTESDSGSIDKCFS